MLPSMPFDYYHVTRSPQDPQRFAQQFIRAIEERARLLHNLRYPVKQATARIRADLDWEFDADLASTPRPKFYKDVPGIVKTVYAHADRGKAPKGKKSKKK